MGKINKKNVMALIERLKKIEQRPNGVFKNGFNMLHVMHKCGTPACIAGHAISLKLGKTQGRKIHNIIENPSFDWEDEAAKWLGISPRQADRLFQPNNTYAKYFAENGSVNFITKEMAIKCLENLLKTGRVDWRKAKSDVRKEAA